MIEHLQKKIAEIKPSWLKELDRRVSLDLTVGQVKRRSVDLMHVVNAYKDWKDDHESTYETLANKMDEPARLYFKKDKGEFETMFEKEVRKIVEDRDYQKLQKYINELAIAIILIETERMAFGLMIDLTHNPDTF